MISIICFSKDRPLQLEAYIQSVLFYSKIPQENLSVIYFESPLISYSSIKNSYPRVNWVQESDFRVDLMSVVIDSQKYILFGCDDVFFTDHFDGDYIANLLSHNPALFSFSLRLGGNIDLPPLGIEVTNWGLIWNWPNAPAGPWRYPWDVSGSIYRKEFIEYFLKENKNIHNPNSLEAEFYANPLERKYVLQHEMGCYKRSKCLTLTVNRVQDEYLNPYDNRKETDTDTLYDAHIKAKKLDWPFFHLTNNKKIHVDSSYFRLTNHIVYPSGPFQAHKLFVGTGFFKKKSLNTHLRIKMIFLRIQLRFKRTLKILIPSRVSELIKKIRLFTSKES